MNYSASKAKRSSCKQIKESERIYRNMPIRFQKLSSFTFQASSQSPETTSFIRQDNSLILAINQFAPYIFTDYIFPPDLSHLPVVFNSPPKSAKPMTILNLEKQGESLTFFDEPDSSAPYLDFECTIAPGKIGPDPHIHPLQTETFHVIQGQMHAIVDGREHIINKGESIVVEPGIVHTFSNPNKDEQLKLKIRIEPALNFQWLLTESAKLAIRNGGYWKDAPLLETAYIFNQVINEYDIPGMPVFIKRLLFSTLAGLAVLFRKTKQIKPLAR